MTSIDIQSSHLAPRDVPLARAIQDAPQDAARAFAVIALLFAFLVATTFGSQLEKNVPDHAPTEQSDVQTDTSELEDWHGNVRRSHWQ